jgi:hypothetical protein
MESIGKKHFFQIRGNTNLIFFIIEYLSEIEQANSLGVCKNIYNNKNIKNSLKEYVLNLKKLKLQLPKKGNQVLLYQNLYYKSNKMSQTIILDLFENYISKKYGLESITLIDNAIDPSIWNFKPGVEKVFIQTQKIKSIRIHLKKRTYKQIRLILNGNNSVENIYIYGAPSKKHSGQKILISRNINRHSISNGK